MAHISRDASKEARTAAHKAKMEQKRRRREDWYLSRQVKPAPAPRANLSCRHPDYGKTPAQHVAAKARRKL